LEGPEVDTGQRRALNAIRKGVNSVFTRHGFGRKSPLWIRQINDVRQIVRLVPLLPTDKQFMIDYPMWCETETIGCFIVLSSLMNGIDTAVKAPYDEPEVNWAISRQSAWIDAVVIPLLAQHSHAEELVGDDGARLRDRHQPTDPTFSEYAFCTWTYPLDGTMQYR
jgi:hypothetical protein